AQLPVEPFPSAEEVAHRTQWVATTFPGPLTTDPVTSFVLHALGTVDPAAGVALLMIDEFTEVVPLAETTTGIAFGFDAPGARVEPRVRGSAPAVGLRAALHDPPGFLGRQWQVGELLGEDAAFPVSVRVATAEHHLSRFRPADGPAVDYDPAAVPLEPRVE